MAVGNDGNGRMRWEWKVRFQSGLHYKSKLGCFVPVQLKGELPFSWFFQTVRRKSNARKRDKKEPVEVPRTGPRAKQSKVAWRALQLAMSLACTGEMKTNVCWIFIFFKEKVDNTKFLKWLWNLAALLILTCSLLWWGSFLWLMKFNLC